MALYDLALPGVPRNEVAHVLAARRRIHRQSCAYIGLASNVFDRERLIVHADVVCRHIEQARTWVERCRLLILGTERRRTNTLGVLVRAVLGGRISGNHLRAA